MSDEAMKYSNPQWRETLSSMEVPLAVRSSKIALECLETLVSEGRLSFDQGVELMKEKEISSVTSLANMVKKSRFSKHVFFNENLHVNSTNICVLACRFCAFRKPLSLRRGPTQPWCRGVSLAPPPQAHLSCGGDV